MAAYNRTVRIKQGETGFVIEATLYQEDDSAVDLTLGGNWTVYLTITEQGVTTPTLIGPVVMTLSDQTLHKGQATYALSDADLTALAAIGDKDLEIKAIEPGGRKHFFPKDDGDTFGTLRFKASKG